MRNKWLRNRRNDISHKAKSFAVLNISFEREGKKKKLLQSSYLVSYPGTNPAEQGLTLLSEHDVVLSLWYSDSECSFFNF